MRGLKLFIILRIKLLKCVASFTDAWIETDGSISVFCDEEVASFTDAWIETAQQWRAFGVYWVASFTDAWIETISIDAQFRRHASHLLQMRGLKPSG